MTSAMWYRAALSSEQIAAGIVDAIRRQFADGLSGVAAVAGACLFATSRDTSKAAVTENTDIDADAVFFSPAAISLVPHLIAHYHAQPSGPPERDRAVLLVGQPADWDLLPHSLH